jgi:hypothetical protein
MKSFTFVMNSYTEPCKNIKNGLAAFAVSLTDRRDGLHVRIPFYFVKNFLKQELDEMVPVLATVCQGDA